SLSYFLIPDLTSELRKTNVNHDFIKRLIEEASGIGAKAVKFWFGSRFFHGHRMILKPEIVKFFRALGNNDLVAVVHISDPDAWHGKGSRYPPQLYGTKEDMRQQMLSIIKECPGTVFVLVHMGGKPESPLKLIDELDAHENLYIDTSATKWVSRELSRNLLDAKELFSMHKDRILFGSDLVIPPWNQGDLDDRMYYFSRYLVQRLMLEHDDFFTSPIIDPDLTKGESLHGLNLSRSILKRIYLDNSRSIYGC
ncbi:MAG: amidohydrolase family protein, partial [Promethearchaeota archaeon]